MIRGATIMGLFVGTLLAVFVFAIKYDVQDLETQFETLNRDIEHEQRAMHVLKAEWSYLNDPTRLSELSRFHLGVSSMTTSQMGELQLIPMRANPDPMPGSPGGDSTGDPPDRLAAIEAALRELRIQGDVQ